jgi:hypothetical protein
MAAPNIVNVASITGVSTFIGITTTAPVVLISNAASSNQVLKLNTLMAANTAGSTASITVKIFSAAAGAGTSVSIASSISIPSGSTLAIIGKDTPLYLEENRSIGVTAGTANAIDIVASYETIS